MKQKDINALTVWVIIMILACYSAYGAFMLAEKNDSDKQRRSAARDYMTQKNCKITGYYGRSGEYKVYTCDDGKVWKESDLM